MSFVAFKGNKFSNRWFSFLRASPLFSLKSFFMSSVWSERTLLYAVLNNVAQTPADLTLPEQRSERCSAPMPFFLAISFLVREPVARSLRMD